MAEPVLLDEWQAVPEAFSAVKRAVDAAAGHGASFSPGPPTATLKESLLRAPAASSGSRLLGMTAREQLGRVAPAALHRPAGQGRGDRRAGGQLDLRDYLDLALRSGFPEALDIGGAAARQRWLEGYVDQIITRDPTGTVGARNPALLLRYLEAYAFLGGNRRGREPLRGSRDRQAHGHLLRERAGERLCRRVTSCLADQPPEAAGSGTQALRPRRRADGGNLAGGRGGDPARTTSSSAASSTRSSLPSSGGK